MHRTLLSLIAAAVIVFSSVAHGIWTMRWTGAKPLEEAAAKVALVPEAFGEWTSEDLSVKKRTMDQAGARGYLSRRYINRSNGQTMMAMLLCGQPGPLAAHTPMICFRATGMEPSGPDKRCSLRDDGSQDWGELFWADFVGTASGSPMRVRLFWGFSPDGLHWQAPSNPRVALAGQPVLLKVFVHREFDRGKVSESEDIAPDKDPCADFLREFLPEIAKTIRAAAEPAGNES